MEPIRSSEPRTRISFSRCLRSRKKSFGMATGKVSHALRFVLMTRDELSERAGSNATAPESLHCIGNSRNTRSQTSCLTASCCRFGFMNSRPWRVAGPRANQVFVLVKHGETMNSVTTRAMTAALLLAAACSSEAGDGMNASPDPSGSGAVPGAGIDPATGLPLPQTGGVDPATGQPVDPATGQPVDPATGQPVDPATGQPVDPATGQPVDPATGQDASSECASAGVPGTSQIPRLSNVQYNRTVFDLVGAIAPGLLAIEQAGPITTSIWDGYQLSADTVAADVMSDPAKMGQFITCTPTGDGAECLSQTIREFGLKAFRRPLTDEEIAGFEGLVAQRNEITATGSFEEVAQVILATFLKSPSFLQRAEIAAQQPGADGNYVLSGYEVASRLSYMLWGSMPDDALFEAAASDQLQTKEQVLAQARRMVTDDKAREVAAEFHRQYIHLTAGSRWDSARKDATLFPQFTEAVVPDMIIETEMLFDNIFASGGTFQDLLTTTKAYVTANTAPLYGLPAAMYGAEPTEVDLDPNTRAGFLTRVGFLAAFSNQTRTSPIIRGAFITKDVLGIDPGPPAAGAADTPLPEGPGLDTNRKRVEQQTSGDVCAGCHQTFINPPGFVLEVFDSSGMVQTTEQSTGAAIDGVADVRIDPSAESVTVNTPGEMMQNIAASVSAQKFYASRWIGFAYGREPELADACAAEALTAKVAAGGYTIQDLLTDLTQTEYFMTRSLDEEAAQ